MFFFIGGLVILAAAVITLIVGFISRHATVGVGGAIVLSIVGGLVIFLSTLTSVPAQNVGVVTEFGKVTGENLSPGLHTKKPWQKVTDMDGTIQQLNNLGATAVDSEEADRNRGRSTVRLNDNNLMFVESALRWKIKPESAPSLFTDYGKGGGNVVETKVTSGLVEKELASTLNGVLGTYNPLTPGAAGQSNDDLAVKVKDALTLKVGDKIQIESFSIIRIDYDEATQARISKVAQAKSDTEIAKQNVLTSEAQAKANKTIADSVKDPGVNTSKCLDLVARGAALPAGFQCFPGSEPARVQNVN